MTSEEGAVTETEGDVADTADTAAENADADVVKILFGHGDDGFQVVILNNVLAQIGFSATSIACKERRTVMHCHNARS